MVRTFLIAETIAITAFSFFLTSVTSVTSVTSAESESVAELPSSFRYNLQLKTKTILRSAS
jgi:hypothetical protein